MGNGLRIRRIGDDMKRKEKAERIQSMLEELYPETPVPLDHETPFQLLVAVLMSAQTTD